MKEDEEKLLNEVENRKPSSFIFVSAWIPSRCAGRDAKPVVHVKLEFFISIHIWIIFKKAEVLLYVFQIDRKD